MTLLWPLLTACLTKMEAEQARDSTILQDSGPTICTVYADSDGDGWGFGEPIEVDCDLIAADQVDNDQDCDDDDDGVNPAASEVCNGVDDDCDGLVDDEDDSLDASTTNTFYEDLDADGFGSDVVVAVTCADEVDGAVTNNEDCDDGDSAVNPAASEICNGLDDDCDGDIDDDDSSLDTSTRSTWYDDADGDGYGDPTAYSQACAAPSGTVTDATDCHDGNADINPGETEVCNGLDDDCDGDIDDDDSSLDTSTRSTWYDDADGDGYGDPDADSQACDAPSGTVADATDCDDSDADIHPGGTEVCNEVDDDCDGDIDDDDSSLDTSTWSTWYEDDDGDGYGDASVTTEACYEPSGYVSDDTDCDDGDGDVNPGASEVCNGIDDDCDGTADSSSVCPCDVERYNSHVYLFCESNEDWLDADASCVAETDFELAVVDDASENSWLTSTMNSYSSSHWWWIGFHDRNATSSEEPAKGWEWVDGSSVSYTNWNSGQPDDWSNDEDCGHLYNSGKWNDLDCDRTAWGSTDLYYICEATVTF